MGEVERCTPTVTFRFAVYLLHINLQHAFISVQLGNALFVNALPMVLLWCGDSCLIVLPAMGLSELSQKGCASPWLMMIAVLLCGPAYV